MLTYAFIKTKLICLMSLIISASFFSDYFWNYTLCDLPDTKAFTYFVRDPVLCKTIHLKD